MTQDIIFKSNKEAVSSKEVIESPYDLEARFRIKGDKIWSGYVVHLTETSEDDHVNVITDIHTTLADQHDIKSTDVIQSKLYSKGFKPKEHLVDTAYITPKLIVESKLKYDISLFRSLKILIFGKTN